MAGLASTLPCVDPHTLTVLAVLTVLTDVNRGIGVGAAFYTGT